MGRPSVKYRVVQSSSGVLNGACIRVPKKTVSTPLENDFLTDASAKTSTIPQVFVVLLCFGVAATACADTDGHVRYSSNK